MSKQPKRTWRRVIATWLVRWCPLIMRESRDVYRKQRNLTLQKGPIAQLDETRKGVWRPPHGKFPGGYGESL